MAWLRVHRSLALLLPAAVGLSACDTGPEDPDDEMFVAGETDGEDEPAPEGEDQDVEPEDDSAGTNGLPPGSGGGGGAPRPAQSIPCDDSWEAYACKLGDGVTGTNYCLVIDGEEVMTPCTAEEPECDPSWSEDYGCMGYYCYWDEGSEQFTEYSWSEPDCNTPLVLNFDDAPVSFEPAIATAFDLSSDGSCVSTDWPTAPWLALDRDGDGFIRSGAELFGNATKMHTGGLADHGFAALAELDDDRDGKITPADPAFSELVLWSDADDDRVGAYGELRPLADSGIVSIDLGYDRRASCDGRGNCGWERAAFEYRKGDGSIASGEVVDVHVTCR